MNGYLMHKNDVVSRIENDIVLDNNALLPLQLTGLTQDCLKRS